MLITLLLWLGVIPAAWGYGKLVLAGEDFESDTESVIARMYTGLLLMSILLFAIALFVNLSWWSGCIVLIPGFVLGVADRIKKNNRVVLLVFGLLMVPVSAWVTTRYVDYYDTALYHHQAIKWMSEYGIVKGVALISFRFAWLSSWFSFAAPFNHGELTGREAGIVGGLAFALMLLPALLFFRNISWKGTPGFRSVFWVVFGSALALICLAWHIERSVGPDMMTWLLSAVILTILTNKGSSDATRIGQSSLIAALACTVKPTSVPVLMYCTALALIQFRKTSVERGKLIAWFAASASVIVLLLYANIMASGCPAFPSSIGCISSDWSVGRDFANSMNSMLHAHALAGRRDQMYFALALSVAATLVVACFRRVNPVIRHGLALSWVGIIFVIVALEGMPRYAIGYFVLPVALAGACVFEWAWNRWHHSETAPLGTSPRQGVSVFVVIAPLVATCIVAYAVRTAPANSLVLPLRMAHANGDPIHTINQRGISAWTTLQLEPRQHGSVTIWMPQLGDQCFDAPLPCGYLPDTDKLTVTRPNEGFRSGFSREGN